MKAYPGADTNSDYNLFCANLRLRLKGQARQNRRSKINIEKLKSLETREKQEIKIDLSKLQSEEMISGCVNAGWEKFKIAIARPNKELLTNTKRDRKSEWITDEILDLIER